MLHMVAEAMLETDRVAKITRNGPGTANSCRAYVAARGAPTQVISGGRSQWRNRSHGAYRCARKAAGGGPLVALHTRGLIFHSYLLAELAELGARRERRLCGNRGD